MKWKSGINCLILKNWENWNCCLILTTLQFIMKETLLSFCQIEWRTRVSELSKWLNIVRKYGLDTCTYCVKSKCCGKIGYWG